MEVSHDLFNSTEMLRSSAPINVVVCMRLGMKECRVIAVWCQTIYRQYVLQGEAQLVSRISSINTTDFYLGKPAS